jgi:aminoglycoside phosphotransferase (APT) family kinase protein
MAAKPPSLSGAEDVRATVAAALGLSLAEAQIESIGLGARNALWRIRGKGIDWVARIAQPRPQLDLDVREEYAAHLAAAHAGLAPRVILAQPAHCLLVMENERGTAWSADAVRAQIALLAARVRELHALPAPEGLKSFELVDGIRSLVGRIRGIEAAGLDLGELESRIGVLAQGYRRATSVFCHNDLYHLNLLGPRPLFIDWEYAALADPLMDLAALATYHDFDVQQRAELLRGYGRDLEIAQLDLVCALFDALHLAWLIAAGVWDDTPVTRRAVLRARVGLRR